jgi:hypothetical protein
MIIAVEKPSRLIVALIALSLLLAIVVVSPASQAGSKPADTAQPLPFQPGEKLIYEGEFTRALLRGVDVADLTFSFTRVPGAQTASIGSKPQTSLRFTGEAISKGIVSKLFGLSFRQYVESTVEPTTFSVLRTTKLDVQGKRKRSSEAEFDPASGRIVFTEVDPNDATRPPRVVTSKADGRVVDIASAFYYLRTLKLEPGTTVELLISDTGVVYNTPVRIVGRERLKTLFGKIDTLRIVPELFGEGRLIRGKGEITIWLSNDARHIPVKAKINNSLGRLDIRLKKFTSGQ